jgi:hypothetical protein
MNVLLDERCQPRLRHVIGALLAAAETADFAVARVRLGAIDLSPAETGGVRRCRILLGRLDHSGLNELMAADDDRSRQLRALAAFLDSGRVEVRSAGMAEWLPDFSVYHRLADDGRGHDSACVVGAHYFHLPPVDGASLTCVLRDVGAVMRATHRFEELWRQGHDVLPAVLDSIRRLVDDSTHR